jgi:hypothetical protein
MAIKLKKHPCKKWQQLGVVALRRVRDWNNRDVEM